MRKIIFALLLGAFSTVQAQIEFAPAPKLLNKYDIIDTCLFKITYKLKIVPDPQKKSYTYNDVQILEIGKNGAKSYSYMLYEKDSICTKLNAKGVSNTPLLQKAVLPMEVFVSGKDNQTTVVYRTILGGPIYIYTEPTENIKWTIVSGRKTILGYDCQKATATFKGRDYEAWFTMDIPSKYGPYKFVGLPGLILSIQDSNKEYNWECIGIKKGNNKTTINKYKWEYNNTTPEKLEQTVSRMYKDPIHFMQSLGAKVRNETNSGLSMSYNPLEK
ncbi:MULTISPECIES: GLPGLI family protein [Bacteroides]|jgi:GLPGLI family protein|uniref:GLPGLI family protein n=1 Tax=Bacteroides TaxID=816 RepID=UPI000E4E79E3|nr:MULTISPECIES: GLPGLI family protein [Bacteroides]RHL02428.1 GLPGLI family protein [Bacteroides sp. AF39-11AC]